MSYRKPKHKRGTKAKGSKFDRAVGTALGKKYDKKMKKEERSGLFYYVLKHLGLRK